LIKLIHSSTEVLIVLLDTSLAPSNLATGLVVAYLMDVYNFNFSLAFKHIQMKSPMIPRLNVNYYDDLLIIENLKKFKLENTQIKLARPGLLTKNYALKRSLDDDDGGGSEFDNDSNNSMKYDSSSDMLDDSSMEIIVGGGGAGAGHHGYHHHHDNKRRYIN